MLRTVLTRISGTTVISRMNAGVRKYCQVKTEFYFFLQFS